MVYILHGYKTNIRRLKDHLFIQLHSVELHLPSEEKFTSKIFIIYISIDYIINFGASLLLQYLYSF